MIGSFSERETDGDSYFDTCVTGVLCFNMSNVTVESSILE
jgi:hypothetical protein